MVKYIEILFYIDLLENQSHSFKREEAAMYPILVKFACYGALISENSNQCHSANVQKVLQAILDKGTTTIEINSQNMGGDPSPGNRKHFGALISQAGEERFYNCGEGESLDFS